MPKNTSASGGKKPRWSAAKKAAAKKSGPRSGPKRHHRGQPDGPVRTRGGRAHGSDGDAPRERRSGRPDRFDRSDRSDRSERARRDDRDRSGRGAYQRDDRRQRWSDQRDTRPERRGQGQDRRDDRRGNFRTRADGERDGRYDRRDRSEGRYDRGEGRYDRRDRSEDRGPRDRSGARDNRRDGRGPRERGEWRSQGGRAAYGKRFDGNAGEARKPKRWDDDRPARRVADPVRRDRHEGRHFDEHRYDLPEQPRTFEEAEAERAQADTWVKYESKKKSAESSVVADDNGFAALGIDPRLVERLARDGITQPFPIQQAAIPDALAGRDVLGRGQTGSGKTLAFGLPTITRLRDAGEPSTKRPHALIMVPTRELAMQVTDALEPLVHVVGMKHRLVAGGLSYEPQIKALARGVDVLIATPGRLADLLERGAVELDEVLITILDEADHMADMGFLPEVTAILDKVPEGGQRLLFSATLDKGIDTLVETYLTDPVTHSTDDATAAVTTMSHHILLIEPNIKKQITAQLASREGRTVIFVRTQLGADRVARELRERGVLAAAIHGGLSQSARNRALGAFREGSLPVLVATDVAARGIHVDDIGLVLQVDPPADHKDYLHRAGRTARAGEKGAVVTLALPHQKRTMTRLAEAAGLDTEPVRTRLGDEVLQSVGAVEPSGVPVPDDLWRPLVEAQRPVRGRGGRGYAGRSDRRGGPRGDDRRGGRSGERRGGWGGERRGGADGERRGGPRGERREDRRGFAPRGEGRRGAEWKRDR